MSVFNKLFIDHSYVKGTSNEGVLFIKGSVSFLLVDQRWEGYEVYLDYKGQRIRLDWLLEVYRNKLTIQQIVKSIGEKSKSQMMDYYASLIFNYGDFIVNQNEVEIDEFIKWHIENSDRIYREYFSLLND